MFKKFEEATKDILGGFKQFILRGSVVDLAVGILIGGAFNTVVSSLVKDIMTPLISAIFKQPNFSTLTFTLHGSQFLYGDFINNLISFLISAMTVYFFVVIPINRLSARIHKGPAPAATTKPCPECLSNIPIAAHRCMYCTTIFIAPESGPEAAK
jgi:large conductance mechanosensitive channel